MTAAWWALALALAGAGAGAGYWLLVVTEGAYLGPRVVRFLYDWGAATYDGVKQFESVDDARALALPLIRELRGVQKALVLDVATGTGRFPLTLLRNLEFEGRIVGLDISFRMLQQARRKAAQHTGRVLWLRKNGQELPFEDCTFHAVSCLEALEFMPRPRQALSEMVRVLAPGGTMLISNRRGLDAALMPGRTFSRGHIRELLLKLGLASVQIKQWQTYYDLVWARKPGRLSSELMPAVLGDLLRCPACGASPLSRKAVGLRCPTCGRSYPTRDDIICMDSHAERKSARAQPG
jgi:ubiquinone/menaquinone biosynthesis C-methylase UbiE